MPAGSNAAAKVSSSSSSASEPYCATAPPRYEPKGSAPAVHTRGRMRGVFDDMDRAVDAAHHAFRAIESNTLEVRAKVIEAMRECGRRETRAISEMAVAETKLGRVDHKLKKNSLVIEK